MGGATSAAPTPLRRAWLDQRASRKSSRNRLSDIVEEAHPADWENIMAGPMTDLQTWPGAADIFSAAELYGELADAELHDEPRQINQ
jgi:hypothetical protein